MKSAGEPIRFGPITIDLAMAMAGLTLDYHPVCLLPEVASRLGYRSPVVHSAWISGLVGLGVSLLFPKHHPSRISVNYHEPAFQGRMFTLTMSVLSVEPGRRLQEVEFAVRDGRRGLIADGKAVMETARGNSQR